MGDRPPDSRPIQQALGQARWLRNKIRDNTDGKYFDVTAVVVFLSWYVPKEQMKYKGIWVMNPNWLESSITQLEPVLTPEEVQKIVKVMRPLTQVKRNSP